MDRFRKILYDAGVEYSITMHNKVVTMADVERTLGISYDQMAKTLIVDVKGELYEVVLQGNDRMDRRKLAECLKTSRKDIDFPSKGVIEEKLGIEVGGIPPFGLGLPVVVDQKLTALDFVYCGCGSVTSTLKIKVKDLVEVANAQIADVAEKAER